MMLTDNEWMSYNRGVSHRRDDDGDGGSVSVIDINEGSI